MMNEIGIETTRSLTVYLISYMQATMTICVVAAAGDLMRYMS